MKTKKLIPLIVAICFFSINVYAQGLLEKNDFKFEYNLKGFNILIVTYDECSYEETVEMANSWKSWNASVDFASTDRAFRANKIKITDKGHVSGETIKMNADFLISEVDVQKYDLVYVVGGDSYVLLMTDFKENISRILNDTYNSGKILSLFCHSPAILSMAPFVKGKRVTVDGKREMKMLQEAGAIIDDRIIVTDGNLITGRFPYTETFINTIAEKLQFPKGNGPQQTKLAQEKVLIREMKNLANTMLFNNTPIERKVIEELVQTGLKSLIYENYSYNHQIRFVCIDNPESIAKVKALMIKNNLDRFASHDNPKERMNSYVNSVLNEVPVLILAFNDLSSLSKDENEDLIQNLASYNGASCQNIALGASSMGLGTKLIGKSWLSNSESEIKTFLDLPENYKLINLIGVGYSDYKFVPTLNRPIGEFLVFR